MNTHLRQTRLYAFLHRVAVVCLLLVMTTGCRSLDDRLAHPKASVRRAAVSRVFDQNVLAKIAAGDPDSGVRSIALGRVQGEEGLIQIACGSRFKDSWSCAIERIESQSGFGRVAFSAADSDVRCAAIQRISDGASLIRLVGVEHGLAIRTEALSRLTDLETLEKLAADDLEESIRTAALARVDNQEALCRLACTATHEKTRFAAVGRIEDQSVLAKVVTEAPLQAIRMAALKKLGLQETILGVALRDPDFSIRRIAFGKLDDERLQQLAETAEDPAIRLAARVRLGRETWADAFRPENLEGAGLGTALGAVALVETPQPSSAAVVEACHTFIRRGDPARIPELVELLRRFGDKSLAEDYMNCGNSQLDDAGHRWASAHGYNVRQGRGSSRVRWGGGR